MNRFLLSLVLTLVFSVLIVLGVAFFHILSGMLNNNLAVLGIGVGLLFVLTYNSVGNMDESFNFNSILDNDGEELM